MHYSNRLNFVLSRPWMCQCWAKTRKITH